MIQKQTLDNMPTTIFTVRTRLKQIRTLLDIWTAMTAVERERRLQGIRLKITIQTEKIRHGCRICSELDLFQLEGMKRAL